MMGNEIRISQVTQEKASAGENLLSKRVTEGTTRVRGALSPSPDVTIKTVENRLDRSVESDADSARPVSQMLRRSEMSASGELRVSVLTQLLSEARNEWPGRSDAKIANSPGASSRGGKKSGSGGSAKQGGTTAQKKAAGRKGGRAAARKS